VTCRPSRTLLNAIVRRRFQGHHMTSRPIDFFLAASAVICAQAAIAEDLSAEQRATAAWMAEQSRAWANQACGGKWVISDLLADDFKGTAPKGSRYEKPSGEPPHDPDTKWSTTCTLDEADVRFFGHDVAVVYGAETKTVALPEGKLERTRGRQSAKLKRWRARRSAQPLDITLQCRTSVTVS
jgi:hypothetical protein